MFSLLILALVGAYVATLFVVAWRSERGAGRSGRAFGPWTYALSLAIYCTSWTYYGAVGTAARDGWEYLPIYLGPAIGLTLLFPIWRRIAAAAKRENIGSIADFVSSRYGKSQTLGAVVAVVAILGSLPYIALQLKSLSMAWQLVTAGTPVAGSEGPTVAVIAALLAGFTILFGARRADLTEHNRGLIQAIALESIVKLAALIAVAGFAMVLLLGAPSPAQAVAALGDLAAPPVIDSRFVAISLLAVIAVYCLPRQFHVAFVEGAEPADIRRARWVFPVYLLITSLAVLPLVAAGGLFAGISDPDLFVLDIPVQAGARILTAIVFVGGFSAATAMVIVETVALSAMASNNLILPLAARLSRRARDGENLAGGILQVRRVVICIVLFLAWLYFQAIDRASGLAAIGLTSFAALAQLAPALFGAVLWREGHARGAVAGILVGVAVWAVFLALPQVGAAMGLPGLSLSGLEDPLPTGVFLSLGLNVLVYVLVSRSVRPSLIDRVQATAFMDRQSPDWRDARPTPSGASVGDLRTLVSRFVGDAGAARAFRTFARETGRTLRNNDPADTGLVRAAERMLAGAVGAASARRVIAAALAGGGRAPEDVVRMLDEASQAVQFNRELLQATLDNIDQGVSVVDEDLRLVAWNARYIELFDLPAGFVHVGLPVADVYRLNAERGEVVETAELQPWIERRLEALRRRVPHDHERTQPSGRVLRSTGAPMTGAGYVTTYSDITELRLAARALEEANERLEARVADRTARLDDARRTAEAAVASKTRFLAAASHDLLQPLHAARLFIAALKEEEDAEAGQVRALADNADRSIESAHGLLRALLNLSRLEAGGVKPSVGALSVRAMFDDLRREFTPVAAAKGVRLTIVPSDLWIASDRDLLRSLLQNLIGNAVRYTDRGAVLVGVRRMGNRVRVDVIDSGRGIPPDQQEAIFGEFTRLPGMGGDEIGAGLGLAIVRRVAGLLDHRLTLESEVGRGSCFGVELPRAAPAEPTRPAPATLSTLDGLPPRRVLCVDNDPSILHGLKLLLARWGLSTVMAETAAGALAIQGDFDAALVDLHLGEGPDGLHVVAALKERGLARIALITADADDDLAARAQAAGAVLMAKPVRPASLKAFLSSRAAD